MVSSIILYYVEASEERRRAYNAVPERVHRHNGYLQLYHGKVHMLLSRAVPGETTATNEGEAHTLFRSECFCDKCGTCNGR